MVGQAKGKLTSDLTHSQSALSSNDSELISTLSGDSEVFFFSYSPTLKTLLSWSDNSQSVLGVKDVSITRDGNLFLRYVHSDDRYLLMVELENALNGLSRYRATYRWIRPDNNQVRWLHCRAMVVETSEDKVFDGMIIDLSDEFTGTVGQIAGPDSLNSVISAFSTLVFTVDRDLRLVRMNRLEPSHSFNFGDSGFVVENFKIGRTLLDSLSDSAIASALHETMLSIIDGKLSYHSTRIVGGTNVFNMEILPIKNQDFIEGLLFNITDITELVKMEHQIANLQKTEGIALLASGVAHNFNNALQAILGQAAIAANHPEQTDLVRQAGNAIMKIVERSSDLSKQLVSFNSGATDVEHPIDINLAAMAAVNRVQDVFSSGIKISVSFGNPDRVRVDQARLVQVLEAIIKNSHESILASGRLDGQISIRTSQIELGSLEVADLPAGVYARMLIADNGAGMPSSVLDRCLEPFFTTKAMGLDSNLSLPRPGLGLAQAFNMMRSAGGHIAVDSTPELGSKVTIYLPIGANDVTNGGIIKKLAEPIIHRPKILLVDDDHLVLETVEAMLRDQKYSCITAASGSEAIKKFKKHLRTIELVIVDAVMPGMDGASLLRELLKIQPHIKVIGFSGALPDQTHSLTKAGAAEILHKPIGPNELENAVRRALKREKPASEQVA